MVEQHPDLASSLELLCLCPPATRTRGGPTFDRRSVTTAVVTMVPCSADQRVVVSAVHDLMPST